MEDEFAAGSGGVDGFLEAAEPDPTLSQASDGVDQMPQRAAKPIGLPDNQGVAGTVLVQDLLEDWPVGRAPRAVSVNTR